MTWRALVIVTGCAFTGFPAGAQDFSQIKIEKIAAGFAFAEGPAWSGHDGALYFSDLPKNRIYKLASPIDLSRQVTPGLLRSDSGGANGNAVDAQGRLYTCESHNRRITRTDPKGKVDVLAEQYEGKRFNAPNDLVVRHDGHVFFTDPAFGKEQDSRELDFFGVFQVSPKGAVSLVAKVKGRPNGITLSPDARTLYVVDSDAHAVLGYDLDHAGAVSNERTVVSGIEGVPDGIRTDEKGNLYIAAKSLFVFDPSGRRLTAFEFSEKPTNCTFGEPDLKTLYVTTRAALYRVHLPVKGSGY